MQQSEANGLDNSLRSDTYRKDCAKRKRFDDSPLLPPLVSDEEQDEHDHEGVNGNGDITPHEAGLNGDVDEEEELTRSHSEQQEVSQIMAISIQHIRQKMDVFTDQVSGLLDSGKSFFIDAATAFEDRIVQLHRNQMDIWEKEIESLRAMDAINEDMNFRLAEARAAISSVRPGKHNEIPS